MIVRTNPRSELREFYPPPYGFLGSTRRHPYMRGMGQNSVVQGVVSGASAAAGVASLVPGGQIVGAILALGAQMTALLSKVFSGCGQTCVLTSDAANKLGDLMSQNVHLYVTQPVRTQSMQAAALANFDNAWNQLVQYCGQPSMSTAGKNCISDRQSGACKWKSSPGGWQQQNGTWVYTWPGAAGSGTTCWNYFVGMRDPIANDPAVQPDSVLATTTTPAGSPSTSILTQASAASGISPLLLVGGALLLGGVVLFSGN
jgi:hypothetical protein